MGVSFWANQFNTFNAQEQRKQRDSRRWTSLR
jgi:hypothetical protein